MNQLLRGALVLVLAPIVSGASTWAAEPPDEGEAAPLVEYVEVNVSALPESNTITTKLVVPLQMTPANVGVVPRLLFTEQDALVLGDALLNVSGLNIQNGGGVHDYFSIRGFESVSSALVMTDGVAEPEVTFYNLYNVEGVEVFKGPAGFLYGKNPLAGAVNVVRKQPLPTDLLDVEGSAGSFGTQDVAVDWNAAPDGGPLSFRINGFLGQSDGYRDDMDSDHHGVNPALTWRIGEDATLNVNYEYVDAEFSPDNGIPLYAPGSSLQLPDVDRDWSYQAASDFSDQTLNRFQVDFDKRLSERLSLRNKTYFRDLDWQTDGTLLQGATDLGSGGFLPFQVVRDRAVLDDHQQFIGNQLELTLSLEQGEVKHRVLAGLEIVHESDDYTFDIVPLADVELFDPSTVAVFDSNPNPFPLTSSGDVRNRVIAPYVVDQMELSERVQLLIGARYDDIDSEGDILGLTSVAVDSFSRDDSKVSPMAGVVYAPNPTLSFYYNAGQSYAPPSTRLVNEQAPEDREPEDSRQIEVGTKKQFLAGRVRTTFSLYRVERENIAITDLFGFTQQSGDQRSRGFEAELAAEPARGLRLFLAYAYNDSELTRFERCEPTGLGGCVTQDYSGNAPIMAPENLANLWVSKSFANGFGVAGGARFVGQQFVDEDNLYEIDSSVTFDAAMFYDLESWRFRLNLKNVTDAEYETRSIAGGRSVVPARPFSASLSIGFRM